MGNSAKSDNDANAEIFAGGETDQNIRAFDWANTPLGAEETWSENLKTAVRIALKSRERIFGAPVEKIKLAAASVELDFPKTEFFTIRKQTEADQKFLFEIAEKIRCAKKVEDLLFALAAAVGEHLQVRRCLFNEIDIENDRETVHRDYCRGVESVAGVHRISAYSSTTSAEIQAGKTVVNRDSKTDLRTAALYEQTYAPVGERAYVAVPLLRENQWVASLWVSDNEPRDWSGAEINLLETVAERAWLAVEKLRSEKALRESEERFSKAFNSSPLAVTITSLKTGKLLEVNETFVDLTGYSREEAIGQATFELGLWERSGDRETELASVIHEGQIRNREFSFQMRNGRKIVGLLSAELLELGGEPCALTVIQDITERKQTEEVLRESEARFRNMADHAPVMIWVTEADGTCTYLSQSWYEFTGQTPETGLGFGWIDSIHPDDQQLAHDIFIAANENREVFNIEYRLRRKDGEYCWAIDSAQPRFGKTGEFLGYIGSVFDITERKQAEESVKHQKTLLEALTESVLDGIMIVSPEGKMLHFNRQFLDIWNFPAEVVESQSDESALEWAAHQTTNPAAFLERVGNVYGQPDDKVREEVAMKDGRVYERFGAPILSGETRLGWVWTFRDITERKRAETNFAFLAEISQDLTGLTSSIDITRAMTGKIGKYFGASNCLFAEVDTAANTAIVDYCWRRDDNAVDLAGNYQLSELVSEEFRQSLIADKPIIIKDVATDSRTAENAAKFGLLKIGSFVNTPFVSDGLLKFVLGFYRPEPYEWRADEIELLGELMTRVWTRIQRACAEENLRESEEKFRNLADNISQLAWMTDESGYIFWYNERWFEYTGTTLEEMQGWGWQSVHDPQEVGRVTEKFKQHLASGEIWEDTFPLRSKTGEFRWFLSRALPIRDEQGNIVRWFGTNTDIEEVRQARLQAEAANRLKDEFLATVSHELRTPLNAILGWSEMLKSGKATGEIAERANETIYRNAKSQAQLIEDLLDVSRIITGKMKLEPRPVQIASVIESAIDTLRPAANAKSIEIEIDLGCKPCMIGGDEQRLQQIVWNLISNAVKFTPEGGKVEVKLENDDSHARLTVKDNGKGIEAKFLPFLFERFRQEDASSTRRHGGLGLGLAIVLNLVELHGG
ncbi:MAG: PAS domain S-box protein, partial [Acidobacteriota bacterium]|nr:PAS domain S-box protein [Acidobacteriota bacterium]